MKYKIFKSSDTNVSKFVFEKEANNDLNSIAVEAVLYRYNSYKDRTVICCSTQCGCPMGCSFCGTGKFFVRNLKSREIVEQVVSVMDHVDCKPEDIKKFQIMLMSMGEPFLNFFEVELAIIKLADLYPNAQLLISTVAPYVIVSYWIEFIELCKRFPQVGIQFSIHEAYDSDRKKLISGKSLPLKTIGGLGELWARETGRKPFFNYCVHDNNSTNEHISKLSENLNPDVWECTLSVICDKTENVSTSINRQLNMIALFNKQMIQMGYSTRIFNPAGQDDIGGGCGQLWYFQKWLSENSK